MANKILADLGLSPLNKFLLVYWISLGFIVQDQLFVLIGVPMYLAELGFVLAVADVGSAALILYGAYLLYNKKKQGAQIAIATAVVVVALWITMAPEVVPLADGLSYLGLFIAMVAGPVHLFPDEYS